MRTMSLENPAHQPLAGLTARESQSSLGLIERTILGRVTQASSMAIGAGLTTSLARSLPLSIAPLPGLGEAAASGFVGGVIAAYTSKVLQQCRIFPTIEMTPRTPYVELFLENLFYPRMVYAACVGAAYVGLSGLFPDQTNSSAALFVVAGLGCFVVNAITSCVSLGITVGRTLR